MQTFFRKTIIYTFIAISFSSSAALAASLSLSPSGSDSYFVQGTAMDGVAGIQFDISYSASQSGTPSVTKGMLVGGAMFAANTTNNPIRVAIISTTPFSGNGTVAILTLPTGATNPSITSYSMIDSKGAPITSGSGIANNDSNLSTTPGIPFTNTTPTPTATPATTAPSTVPVATGSTIPSVLGTVTMAGESRENSQATPAAKGQEIAIQPVTKEPSVLLEEKNGETVKEKPAEQQKTAEATQVIYSSVLDRFRTYKGEVSPLILTALFSKPVAANVVQEPAIAITNGSDTIKVTFTLKQDEKSAPNFALTGSKMISLANSSDNAGVWTLEALPNKSTLATTITMISGNEIVEYPLVVVPTANEITDKETDFAIFLKDTGAKNPKRDLNGDGIHDYQDNYIYTAYYILLQKSKEKPAKAKTPAK